MGRPDLSLYLGQKVIAITQGPETWEWGIKLESGVEIRSKDPRETFRPKQLVNHVFQAMSMSVHDTTLHFAGPGATMVKFSFNPTRYVIADPVHGGEVYPQWPEDLEIRGVPAIEGGELSSKPDDEVVWQEHEGRLRGEQARKRQVEAKEFLKEE